MKQLLNIAVSHILGGAFLCAGLIGEVAAKQLILTTHDLVACGKSADRDLCYISLYIADNRGSPLTDRELISETALMERVANAYPERVEQLPPDPETKAFLEATSGPFQAAEDALIASLELDKAGAPAPDSIKPIRDLANDLPSRSFFSGQITTPSGAELRISAARKIFELFAASLLEPSVFREDETPSEVVLRPYAEFAPSRDIAVSALGIWEREVGRKIRTFTNFDQTKSRRALAAAYGAVADKDSVERVLRRLNLPAKERARDTALFLGDLEAAWVLIKEDIYGGKDGRGRLHNIHRYAKAFGKRDLMSIIAAELQKPIFRKKLGTYSVINQLSYFDEETRRGVEDDLLSRENVSESFRAGVWLRRGELSKLESRVSKYEQEIMRCTEYENCPFKNYIDVLAVQNKAIRAKSVLTSEAAHDFLSGNPFYPYQAEIEKSVGVPSTMNWMLELLGEEHSGTALLNINECMEERFRKYKFQPREGAMSNLDAAYQCAMLGVEFARTPSLIAFERSRIEAERISYAGVSGRGRYGFAYSLFEFADYIAEDHPKIAEEIETEALRLLSEAPPIRLGSTFLYRKIALRRIQTER